jgi:Ni,Fe-hydrogenase I cytochrome b subunit
MWLLLGFFVHHVASAVLMSVVERKGTVESIFSGVKFITHGERDGDET